MEEAAPAVLDVTLETMIEDMTVAMKEEEEEVMIAMKTEITTDHTENAPHRPTTEDNTGPGPGHDPILHVAIKIRS